MKKAALLFSCVWGALLPGCAKFSTSISMLDPGCSAVQAGPNNLILSDPATSASFLTLGAPEQGIFDALNTALGFVALQNGLSFGTGLECDNPSTGSQSSCVLFFFASALSSQVTPANVEISARATGSANLVVRADSAGNAISLGYPGGPNKLNLAVIVNGVASSLQCVLGVDTASDCPASIFAQPGQLDLKVTGCNPNVEITVSVGNVLVPKLTAIRSGPNSGRVGVALGAKSSTPTPALDTVEIIGDP